MTNTSIEQLDKIIYDFGMACVFHGINEDNTLPKSPKQALLAWHTQRLEAVVPKEAKGDYDENGFWGGYNTAIQQMQSNIRKEG